MKLATLVLLTGIFTTSTYAAVEVIDDAGRVVRLEQPARRIVSLSPHATELLYAAGAGEYVVAVSEYSNWPSAARKLPRVGSGAGLNVEAIVAQKPDLVVAWLSGNAKAQLQQLERFGVPVFYSEPRDIDGIAENLLALGRLAGSETVAESAALAFRGGVQALRKRYAGRRPVSAFYQIWSQPLMTINGQHLISHWLRLCGAQNIFTDLPDLAPAIDPEAVLKADPEMLLAGRHPGKREDWTARWRKWKGLRAVQSGYLFTVPAEILERQTPRALQAAQELCKHVDVVRQGAASAVVPP
ncbi:Vitamin B12 ABC transporter, substrate-binding protein BtuF [hydrothermal vent metagenome]|uniref:Vitamin B12 ABC transporter, substrate-binding protein BtuF n=1 Tax=hydrothermal vent metagenome TaxID=652676 RepID=A0A3B0Y8F7_9ZZZZ